MTAKTNVEVNVNVNSNESLNNCDIRTYACNITAMLYTQLLPLAGGDIQTKSER